MVDLLHIYHPSDKFLNSMFSINTEGLQFPEDPCSFLQFKIVILKVKGNRRFVVIGASCMRLLPLI